MIMMSGGLFFMVATTITNVFERVYTVMKMSLMFWVLTLMGGVVLGVGPAFLVLMDLYHEHGWEYRGYAWRNLVSLFKTHFKRGNALFYTVLFPQILLGYNVYLATQVKHPLFFVLDFILIAMFIFLSIAYIYALVLNAAFEIDFYNLIKLSVISVFVNFFKIFRILMLMMCVLALTYRYKGLILFGSIGIYIALMHWSLNGWIHEVDEKIEIL